VTSKSSSAGSSAGAVGGDLAERDHADPVFSTGTPGERRDNPQLDLEPESRDILGDLSHVEAATVDWKKQRFESRQQPSAALM
jgi:hypothetical protein